MGPKPTRKEVDDRVAAVAKLLGKKQKWEIKRFLQKNYGPMTSRSCENYISRARAQILEQEGISKNEKKISIAAEFLEIANDPATTPIVRIKALVQYCKCYGLFEPFSVHQHNTGSVEIEVHKKVLEKAKADPELMRALQSAAARISQS